MMKVNELFGPTIQGEGPSTGTPAFFVRLNGCNFDCSWCDTPYTWKEGEKDPDKEMSAMDVLVKIKAAERNKGPFNLIVISGGEPMMQQKNGQFVSLILQSLLDGNNIEIETNGSITPLKHFKYLFYPPEDEDDSVLPILGEYPAPAERAQLHSYLNERIAFNISPKLANSGVKTPLSYLSKLKEWAEEYTKWARFKFVVHPRSLTADLAEIKSLQKSCGIKSTKIWLMPEGITRKEQQRAQVFIAQAAIENGYNFSARQHVLLWDNTRAV